MKIGQNNGAMAPWFNVNLRLLSVWFQMCGYPLGSSKRKRRGVSLHPMSCGNATDPSFSHDLVTMKLDRLAHSYSYFYVCLSSCQDKKD